ncbi:MAG: DUF2147 domain-containing protein [Pseudomonadota bacterium]
MRIPSVAIVGLSLVLGMCANAHAGTDGVLGLWTTIDDNSGKPRSVVRLYEENGKLMGDITKIFPEPDEDPNPVCDECTDHRAGKPIIGMRIVTGLEKGDERWQAGKILDPENGKEYRAEIWREGDILKVRGYLMMFYRTQQWMPAN